MLLYVPGEEDPIAALYDRYAAMLYRLALSTMKNREDAEDVVQSVFEKYVLRPHLFLSREHEKAWMLRVTMNQCKAAFAALGAEEIPALGQPFDPAVHNAVMHVEEDSQGENTIVEVFQTGFKLGEKVIRYAMVKVAN